LVNVGNENHGTSGVNMKTKIQSKQVKEKAPIDEFNLDDNLAVDAEVLAEIKGKGLVHRWINASKYKQNFGFDARRWQPYKRENQGNSAFGFVDSEGYTRRGDLILAVRSVELNAAHKAKIERKNMQLSAGQNKAAADQLRQHLKDSGVTSSKVYEGYEENGDED
jgi:hypothetical protein